MIRHLAVSAALFFLAGGAAAAASPPPTPAEVAVFQENGAYIFRASGQSMPLYTFDRDQPGTSNCNGPCATAWPPVAAAGEGHPVGDWTTVKRADGSYQWALHGMPVYTFAQDQAANPTGDGKGGVWHLVPSVPAD